MHPYTIIRSSRRTLALEIRPTLEIVVRAPREATDEAVAAFVTAHEGWLDKHLPRMRARQEKAAAREVTPEEEAVLRRLAEEKIPPRVAYYSAGMGVVPTSVKITGARRRLGSCSGKNAVCFSWRLMQYPAEAVDYVVVHELAHIRHHNDSRAFYALVEQVLPDYRQRQALLRD